MINITGTTKLSAQDLIAYVSPKIRITGQASSLNNSGSVNLDLEILSQDSSQMIHACISVPTSTVEQLMEVNEVDGATFVSNLYSLLEQLLGAYLQELNPEISIELI